MKLVQGIASADGSSSPLRFMWRLLLLALALRLLLFAIHQPWDPSVVEKHILQHDARGYHELAVTLVEHGRFAHSAESPLETFRAPLYPAFVALTYAVSGNSPWLALLLQALLDSLACLLLYDALRRLLSPGVAAVAAVLYACDPFLILYSSGTLLSDSLSVFLLVTAFWFAALTLTSPEGGRRLRLAAGGGLFLGLAALARPIAQFSVFCYALFYLLAFRHRLRTGFQCAVVCALATLAAVSPWLIRNQIVFGSASISTAGPRYLLVMNVLPVEVAKRHQDERTVMRALVAEADSMMRADGLRPEDLNEFQQAKYWRQLSIRYLARNPGALAERYATGLVRTMFNLDTQHYVSRFGLRAQPLDLDEHAQVGGLVRAFVAKKGLVGILIGGPLLLYLLFVYTGTAIGVVTGWSRYRRSVLLLCLLLGGYLILLSATSGFARYRLPAVPFGLAFAGIGWHWVYRRLFRRQRRGPPAE